MPLEPGVRSSNEATLDISSVKVLRSGAEEFWHCISHASRIPSISLQYDVDSRPEKLSSRSRSKEATTTPCSIKDLNVSSV